MRQSDGDKDGILSKREFNRAIEYIGVDTTGVHEQELLAVIGRLLGEAGRFVSSYARVECTCRVFALVLWSVVLLCCLMRLRERCTLSTTMRTRLFSTHPFPSSTR
jgi:hypothetical protein